VGGKRKVRPPICGFPFVPRPARWADHAPWEEAGSTRARGRARGFLQKGFPSFFLLEGLLSLEEVSIMPLYAVATGPIIGSLSPCDRRLSVEGSLVRPGGGLLSRRDCICLFIEYNLV